MNSRQSDFFRRGPAPDRRGLPALQAGRDAVRLFEEDEDLAAEVGARVRFEAHEHVTAPALCPPVGELARETWVRGVGNGLGLLVLDGVLACDTCVTGRTATELVGSGDLVQVREARRDDFLHEGENWRVLAPARLAVLDGGFLERTQPWPQVAIALLRRSTRRYGDLDVLRAIASHPRLEERLILLLWHLAARWGRVERAGIRLTLPLTHRLIGQMVAAERPSVSHALIRLSEAGLLQGSAGDLHLRGTIDEHMRALATRHARDHPRPRRSSTVPSHQH